MSNVHKIISKMENMLKITLKNVNINLYEKQQDIYINI